VFRGAGVDVSVVVPLVVCLVTAIDRSIARLGEFTAGLRQSQLIMA
jgi:hypothetical protein